MLTRRTLTFPGDRHTVTGSLLPRELFDDCRLAEQLVQQAQAQARQILDQARSEALLLGRQAEEQARAEVLDQSLALLEDLRDQHQRREAAMLEVARELVSAAVQQVLNEQPPLQRIEAVLGHLLSAQPDEPLARLHCHPERLEELATCLQHGGREGWSLQGDPRLAADALSLRTERGEFNLDWHSLVQHVLP
ncbi:type III secretion system stator protein SctL [Pseudomonas sp. 21LCFQ02]|uniref:type III secretion system stator protein SctL n=1 Tax=Pseudomonas sp. 21LCFQ02 TaxID=2957505 RepID=UPI00209B0BD9|nr:type III secretion system stator protein SctL [Pseudomonas sp. 21LCFQ02]MCO8169091.1 type III secretion system stator protein SctL [Pseudomonas sp. 21LCFQ02]